MATNQTNDQWLYLVGVAKDQIERALLTGRPGIMNEWRKKQTKAQLFDAIETLNLATQAVQQIPEVKS